MPEIILSNGELSLVDVQDFQYLRRFKWHKSKNGYAVRSTYAYRKRGSIYMHREITDINKSLSVDHINGQKLDNRRKNLRICPEYKNRFNTKRYKNNTSGVKGVMKRRNKWVVRIAVAKKRIWLGTYSTLAQASHAYDEAAKIYFGDFARLNNAA